MRPLVVGPSPVMTPSRTIVSACAAVLRQEIFDGSSAPIGSAMWATGADIGRFLFSFSCSRSQHVHAGVNEWLTIRKSHRVVFKGLRICRCDVRHGSRQLQGSQPPPAAVGRASGNTGAIGLWRPLWFFRRTGAVQKKMLEPPGDGEGFYPLPAPVHLRAFALYAGKDEFPCNSNDMRS